MQINKEPLREDFQRDLYWTRLSFASDDNSKQTQIHACWSQEYLFDKLRLSGKEKPSGQQVEELLESVLNKWSKLGDAVFNQSDHYDVYANTKEGEANGLDFLLNK